ncbi:hypothetical protein EN35_05105 [Rhodococcus qingshengii]|nr:hypothetical protein EN35_05105 [Rhodococcus qingshengii]
MALWNHLHMKYECVYLGETGTGNEHVWVLLVGGELAAALNLSRDYVLRFIAAKHVSGQEASSSAGILLSHVQEKLARERNFALCHDNCLSARGEVLMAEHEISACGKYEGEVKVLPADKARKMRDEFFEEVLAALAKVD